MFTVEQRDAAREGLLTGDDPRVVAAAVVGAEAAGRVDRWSDLDLTFGVADGTPMAEVLDEWTREVQDTLARPCATLARQRSSPRDSSRSCGN